jgi:hypothetical protein
LSNGRVVNAATRKLCSKVLLDPGFADLVFRVLCVRGIRRLAPCPGIDLVVLARHAAWAVRERRHRHRVLAASLPLAVASTPLILVSLDLWIIFALWMVVGPTLWAIADQVRVDRAGIRLLDGGGVADLGAGLLSDEDERRLAEVNDTNLSIYADALGRDPFPGLGQHVVVPQPTTVLDLTKPLDESRSILSFSKSQLLDHLEQAMPKHLVTDGVDEACHVGMVLSVQGSRVELLPELLPVGGGRPAARAPADLVRQHTDEPLNHAWSALCAQIVGSGGRVVTTLHITASSSGPGMQLELTLHVLRPVHSDYDAGERLPKSGFHLGWRLLAQGQHLRRLLYSPLWARQTTRLMGMAARGVRPLPPRPLDPLVIRDPYGAYNGLREATSLRTRTIFKPQGDGTRQLNELITTAFHEIGVFLRSSNIDTTDLWRKEMVIVQAFASAYHETIGGPYEAPIRYDGTVAVGDVFVNDRHLPNLR